MDVAVFCCVRCFVTGKPPTDTRYQIPEIIKHHAHHHQMIGGRGSRLALLVIGVVV